MDGGHGWEERLFALLDDLEGQADALLGTERALEVEERARAEYAVVTLIGRLHAAVGGQVSVAVTGAGTVSGALHRVGADWFLLGASGQDWIVPVASVGVAHGLPAGSVAEAARPITAKLGLGSALRRVSESGEECRVRLRDGTAYDARLGRVGGDFLEALVGDRRAPVVVPFAALAAVHTPSR
jgi:hypothetical protein